jgi:hypothetical protein
VLLGELSEGWQEVLRNYACDSLASDSAPGEILISAEINDRLAEILPEHMVGCALNSYCFTMTLTLLYRPFKTFWSER